MKIFIETQDNSIEDVIKTMLMREYHFSVNGMNVAFRKGVWTLTYKDEESIKIDDSPSVLRKDDSAPTLGEAFIQSRIEWHNAHTFEEIANRTIPVCAMYDYIKLRTWLEETEHVDVSVTKSHR